jgi:FtsP/CotA-like multicopper oxidase with cupredoxin domain
VIINGPATADYDEDLGAMFLSDWAHESVFKLWGNKARAGDTPVLENTLINGTNTFDCSNLTDANCIGNGTKYETNFVSGTKYRIRLINTVVDAHFHFSIDNHTLTVVRIIIGTGPGHNL